ncbi:MAG: hypothetical protein ACRDND_22015 [Streptosporangiaceae bacterium]
MPRSPWAWQRGARSARPAKKTGGIATAAVTIAALQPLVFVLLVATGTVHI